MNHTRDNRVSQILRKDLEPAGGFEHPICRIRYGRSGIKLHRLIFKCIQLGSRIH